MGKVLKLCNDLRRLYGIKTARMAHALRLPAGAAPLQWCHATHTASAGRDSAYAFGAARGFGVGTRPSGQRPTSEVEEFLGSRQSHYSSGFISDIYVWHAQLDACTKYSCFMYIKYQVLTAEARIVGRSDCTVNLPKVKVWKEKNRIC